MLNGAALYVIRAEDNFFDFGQRCGLSAHGAGFERDDEGAVFEVFAAGFFAGCADGEQLGVGGGVAAHFDLVMGGGKEVARGIQHGGGDGDFAVRGGGFGEQQQGLHGWGHGVGYSVRYGRWVVVVGRIVMKSSRMSVKRGGMSRSLKENLC